MEKFLSGLLGRDSRFLELLPIKGESFECLLGVLSRLPLSRRTRFDFSNPADFALRFGFDV
jgi:hypothetical protein